MIIRLKAIFRIIFCYEFVLVTGKKYKSGFTLTKQASEEVYRTICSSLIEDVLIEEKQENALNEFIQIITDTQSNQF